VLGGNCNSTLHRVKINFLLHPEEEHHPLQELDRIAPNEITMDELL